MAKRRDAAAEAAPTSQQPGSQDGQQQPQQVSQRPAARQARGGQPWWMNTSRLLAIGMLMLVMLDSKLPYETYLLGGPGYGARAPVSMGNVSERLGVPASIEMPPWGNLGSNRIDLKAYQWSKTPSVHDQLGIEGMRTVGMIASRALDVARRMVAPGVTTDEIDQAVHRYIVGELAYPSPLNFNGFPKSICTSVNEVMVHGIPDDRPLEDGDILNVDVTVFYEGLHADTSATFLVGNNTSGPARQVVSSAFAALEAAVAACGPGRPLGDIGRAVQAVADASGTSTVRTFIGHGIGKWFHSAPRVYAFAPKGWWDVVGWLRLYVSGDYWRPLVAGQTLTVEPILVEPRGSSRTAQWRDGWTTTSVDGSLNAQFEYTVLVQEPGSGPGQGGCEVLTPFLWMQPDDASAVGAT